MSKFEIKINGETVKEFDEVGSIEVNTPNGQATVINAGDKNSINLVVKQRDLRNRPLDIAERIGREVFVRNVELSDTVNVIEEQSPNENDNDENPNQDNSNDENPNQDNSNDERIEL